MASQKNTTANDAADEQSMEEILQSIRRIIAEEGDGQESGESAATASESEDVLELTDIVEDNSASEDPLATIDAIMATQSPTPEPEPAPIPMPAPKAFAPPELPKPQLVEEPIDQLLSDSTAAAAISSLRSVRDSAQRAAAAPQPHTLTFRSGTTVEDLIIEALRPMLKEWLDANLPQTVERIVHREIHRLASEAVE